MEKKSWGQRGWEYIWGGAASSRCNRYILTLSLTRSFLPFSGVACNSLQSERFPLMCLLWWWWARVLRMTGGGMDWKPHWLGTGKYPGKELDLVFLQVSYPFSLDGFSVFYLEENNLNAGLEKPTQRKGTSQQLAFVCRTLITCSGVGHKSTKTKPKWLQFETNHLWRIIVKYD